MEDEIKEYLHSRGITNDLSESLSEHLSNNIRASARELADILRKEFGEPNKA